MRRIAVMISKVQAIQPQGGLLAELDLKQCTEKKKVENTSFVPFCKSPHTFFFSLLSTIHATLNKKQNIQHKPKAAAK